MALSKTFFGMRHGSTKTHTYRVLTRPDTKSVRDGVQITQDRTDYKRPNPTVGQSSQNIKMTMVAYYWKMFPQFATTIYLSSYVKQNVQMYPFDYQDVPYLWYQWANLKKWPFEITSYPINSSSYPGIGNIVVSFGHGETRGRITLQDGQPCCKWLGEIVKTRPAKSIAQLSNYLVCNYPNIYQYGDVFAIYSMAYYPIDDEHYSKYILKPHVAYLKIAASAPNEEDDNGRMFFDSDGNIRATYKGQTIIIGDDGVYGNTNACKIVQTCSVFQHGNLVSPARFLVIHDNISERISAEVSKNTYFPQTNVAHTGGGNGIAQDYQNKRDTETGAIHYIRY